MTSNDDPNRIEKQAHRYAGYEAHDQRGEPVGHVDDLFVDRVNGQEYVELNMGVLGLRSTIVPLEICTVDEVRLVVVIPQSRTKLRRAPRKRSPLLGDEVMAVTPEYEDRIREYFGLEPIGPATEERPFRAFSTAYPSGGEASSRGGEVRPVEYRRLDSRPVEPETARRPAQASDEPGATEAGPVEERAAEPDALEAQEAESVEPEVVGSQDVAEAAGRGVAEPDDAVEPLAQQVRAAESEASAGAGVPGREAEEWREAAEPEPIDLAAEEADYVRVVEAEDKGLDVAPEAEVMSDLAGESRADDAQGPDAQDLSAAQAPEPVEAAPGADEGRGRPAGEEAPQEVPLAASAQEVESAGRQMTEAARQSFQALADRAVRAQESNLDLSRSLAQQFVEQLQSQTQGNRQAAQTLQQQGQRQQQAFQTIIEGSVNAYTNLLASTFSLYGQTLQSATRIALGNFQAAARLAQPVVTDPAAAAQRGAEAAGQGLAAVEQPQQGIAPSGGRTEDAGGSSPGGAEESSVRTGDSGEATEPPFADRQDTGSGGEGSAVGGSQEEGGVDRPIDAAPSEGMDESSNPLLPPPPEVPNILDELPPANPEPTEEPSEGRRGERE